MLKGVKNSDRQTRGNPISIGAAILAAIPFLTFLIFSFGNTSQAQGQAADSEEVFSAEGLAADLNDVLSSQPVIIAAGPAGSMNYITSGLLCEVVGRALLNDAPRCLVQPTTGSTANLHLLMNGQADLAFIQSDREYFAAEALGPYEGNGDAQKIRRVAAIAGLPIQVIVKATAGIDSLEDLEGSRIGLGEEGTAQRLIGRVVLSTSGVAERDLALINKNRPADQVTDFCGNQLDAIILPTSAPSPLVTELLRRCNGKLLNVVGEAFDTLTADNSYLVPLEIPSETYVNQPDNISSIGYVVSLVSYEGRRVRLIETIASELPQVYGSLASRFDGIGLVPEDKLFDLGQSARLHQGVASQQLGAVGGSGSTGGTE